MAGVPVESPGTVNPLTPNLTPVRLPSMPLSRRPAHSNRTAVILWARDLPLSFTSAVPLSLRRVDRRPFSDLSTRVQDNISYNNLKMSEGRDFFAKSLPGKCQMYSYPYVTRQRACPEIVIRDHPTNIFFKSLYLKIRFLSFFEKSFQRFHNPSLWI